MNEETIPKPPVTSIVFGLVIYWVTIVGSIIVVIGSIIAFITKANYVPPSHWFTSLWQGNSTGEIWERTASSTPVGHWYMSQLATGDGLAALGISIGVSAVTITLLISAIMLFRLKSMLYGTLALVAAIIIVIATLGLTPLPS